MSLREHFLTAANGDPTAAAVALARGLMAGDPTVFKVGYSQVNAVLAAAELFPEVSRDAIDCGIDAALDERAARRAQLVEHFGVESWALESGDLNERGRRYASVCGVGDYENAHLTTFDDLDAALDDLADRILDGQAPDGVYDLDTAQKIEIHVSTPIVTASEDRGITVNPLQA